MAFDENGNRDNMLQSVVLELLEYIRKVCTGAVCLFANHDSACLCHLMFFCVQENLKPLIEYVFESFWDKLEKFEPLQSIMAFRLKYYIISIKYGAPEKASNLFTPYFACMQ